LIEMIHDVPRCRNLIEELLGRPATLGFLIENRLAKLDAFTTNIDVARTLYEGPDIAVALSTERAKRIFLGRSGITSTTWHNILTLRHNDS
jgi:hypothetical protein